MTTFNPKPIAGIIQFNAVNGRNPIPYSETPADTKRLYFNLLEEEVCEFEEAYDEDDETGMVDALGDIIVVAVGNLYRMGYNPSEVISEINRSNMSKLGADGLPVLSDAGKILKGPNYSPPNLTKPHLKLNLS